jgi:biopolymer transport protein ExbD
MLRRSRRSRRPAIPQLQVVSLIDIMIFILIFYMLISQLGSTTLDVTLPSSSTAQPNDLRSIIVTITAAGEVYVDDRPTTWDSLPALLQESASGPAELVRVRADAETRHKDVVRAFDCIRAAGLSNIAIEAERDSGTS